MRSIVPLLLDAVADFTPIAADTRRGRRGHVGRHPRAWTIEEPGRPRWVGTYEGAHREFRGRSRAAVLIDPAGRRRVG